MKTERPYTRQPAYQGLLQDILENPNDDAPRLILADWLEDHGEPERAAFIRNPFASIRCCHVDELLHGLRLDRAELGTITPYDEVEQFPDLDPRRSILVQVRHGFLSSVACPLALWARRGPAIVKRQPCRAVRSIDVEPRETWGGGGLVWPEGMIPADILHRLATHQGPRHADGEPGMTYRHVHVAREDLSSACLKWARQQARLASYRGRRKKSQPR